MTAVPPQDPMEYISTRGSTGAVDFEGALFSGYAPDGGLFMPRRIPSLDGDTLRRWSCLSYRDLVKELCSLFITAELVPRSTLNGEPQPHRELLAGMCMGILGCSDASASLHPIPFSGPRGQNLLHHCPLLSVPSSTLSLCWGLLPSGKGVPCVQIGILVTAIALADAVVLLTAPDLPSHQGFLLFHTLIEIQILMFLTFNSYCLHQRAATTSISTVCYDKI